MFKLFKRSQPVTDTYEILKSIGIGAPTTSGKHVNSEIAQTLPAVYCAVATIAEEVASLPLHVYTKSQDNRQRVADHYAEVLLNLQPNEYQTPYDFRLALLRAVLLRGNGYARIEFDQGTPVALHLIHPDSIIVEQLDNGRLIYQVTNKKGSPIFLQDYSNSTYSNFSEASRAFLTQSLRPWLTNLQQAFASRLVDNRQLTLEFQTKDLLRATAAERFEVYDNAIRNGIMNPNECRKAENMPPREGGDEYSQSWSQQAQAQDNANDEM